MAAPTMIVFGYCGASAPPALRNRFARFAEVLGRRSKLEVSLFESSSYQELAKAVVAGYVDVAWLPPVPFLTLDRRGAVAPLVHMHRGGSAAFHSAVVVRKDAPIATPADLRGMRAAWVDEHSASGYVVPRLRLAALGVDARVAFAEERFWRSHEAVVRAVVERRADFGATYAGIADDGAVARGPWLEMPAAADAVCVLVAFGGIPGDVVAARSALDAETRDRLLRTLLGMSRDKKSRLLASDAFGVDEFRTFAPEGYDELRKLSEAGIASGLID